jgi:hypothetical protein
MVAEIYSVRPDFESYAYLERFDRPLLAPDVRHRLEEATAGGHIRVALYTLRPSLPPVEIDESTIGYSPEAEMARALARLEPWPIIGIGKLRWLAQQAGEEVERLIKPSPIQALAAVGAAWSGQEAGALEAAMALYRDGELRPPLAYLGPITLHVFEDNTDGLEAVKRGVETLRAAAGVTVEWRFYGVTPADGPKAAAMAARDVPTYLSVNEAILDALALI